MGRNTPEERDHAPCRASGKRLHSGEVEWTSLEPPSSRGGEAHPQTNRKVCLKIISSKEPFVNVPACCQLRRCCPLARSRVVRGNAAEGWDSPTGGRECAKVQTHPLQVALNMQGVCRASALSPQQGDAGDKPWHRGGSMLTPLGLPGGAGRDHGPTTAMVMLVPL